MADILRKNKYRLSVHHIKDKGLLFLDFEISIKNKSKNISMLYYLDLTQTTSSSYRISRFVNQPFYICHLKLFQFNGNLFYLREVPLNPDVLEQLKTTPAKQFIFKENIQTHCICKVNHYLTNKKFVNMSSLPVSYCQYDPITYAESKYAADSYVSIELISDRIEGIPSDQVNLRKQLKVNYSSDYYFMDAPLNSKSVFINRKWRLLSISCDILDG